MPIPFLAEIKQGVGRIEADDVLDLFEHLVDAGDRQVDLVDDRDDLQARFDRRIRIGDRLRLHPLKGVDQQQRPFARRQRPRDLVGEVDMAGRVDEVQLVGLAFMLVQDGDGPRLDGDAPVPLDVEVVQNLLFELPLGDRPGFEQQLVGQRALAVVDVGDDREVTNELRRHSRGYGIRDTSCGIRDSASGGVSPLTILEHDSRAPIARTSRRATNYRHPDRRRPEQRLRRQSMGRICGTAEAPMRSRRARRNEHPSRQGVDSLHPPDRPAPQVHHHLIHPHLDHPAGSFHHHLFLHLLHPRRSSAVAGCDGSRFDLSADRLSNISNASSCICG